MVVMIVIMMVVMIVIMMVVVIVIMMVVMIVIMMVVMIVIMMVVIIVIMMVVMIVIMMVMMIVIMMVINDSSDKWWLFTSHPLKPRWKFATDSVLNELVRRRRRMWSWDVLKEHRDTCKQYKNAYKQKLITNKPGAELLGNIEVVELLIVIVT